MSQVVLLLLPSDHFSYIHSGPKTLFSLEEQYIPLTVEITHESTIPPHHRLIYNHIISLREINATYRACFTEINTGKELQITGKWTGKFFIQNRGRNIVRRNKVNNKLLIFLYIASSINDSIFYRTSRCRSSLAQISKSARSAPESLHKRHYSRLYSTTSHGLQTN